MSWRRNGGARQLEGRRLLYDCFHCRYDGKTGLCYCDKDRLVSRRTDNAVTPAEVLRGERFKSCQECKEFDGEE